VLFFERKPASETPWTQRLWIYDLRTNGHFTLKQNTLNARALRDFVTRYNPEDRHERKETERFRAFGYDDIVRRDIFWLRDRSLAGSEYLQPPDIIAAEISENLEAALEQFAEIHEDLIPNPGEGSLRPLA
jgi:type I restriction enzyme M protein